jgi:hypothetical protein
MNKVFMSFSSINDWLQESMITLADIREASILVFNCSRSYWDSDKGVPIDVLTLRERWDYAENNRKQIWIPEERLPDNVVWRWKELQETIRYVDHERTVINKEEWNTDYRDYYQYAEALSTQGTFVFMGANLWVPRARNFLQVKHNDAFFHILSGGLNKGELCVLIDRRPEHWKQYEELVDYLPFWDPIPRSGKTAEATV